MASTTQAQNGSAPPALFSGDELLEFTLTGPHAQINRARDKDQEYQGTLSYDALDLSVKLAVRGNSRLRKSVCKYAPLWLDFKKKEVDGTLFEDQNRLKLVVQCHDRRRYQSYLALEQQAYSMLNELTDLSLRARLVRVRYLDSDNGKEREQLAILLQHHKKLARSAGMSVVSDERIPKSTLAPDQSTLIALYMFLISNTDFSFIASGDDGSCCHNVKALRDEDGVVFPVPYDFDVSGYVDTSYAEPAAVLKQRDVRDRIYRGFCVERSVLDEARANVLSRKPRLMQIASNAEYSGERYAGSASRFLNRGFKLLEDDQSFEREVAGACR